MLFKGSFEDFIYILIGVVWIGFSIYKGVSKNKALKQQSPAGEKPQPKPKSAFDSFLENLMHEEEKQVPHEPVEVEEEVKVDLSVSEPEKEKVFSYDDYYDEGNQIEQYQVLIKETAQKPTLDKKLNPRLKKQTKKPQFDLRKAVIYSEILNRRYF